MELFALILAMALGLTFLFSGVLKLFDLSASARAAASVGLLPEAIGSLFGYLLPFIELLMAGLLLSGYLSSVAGVVSAILLISFILANRRVMSRDQDLACNCFGNLFAGRMGRGALAHSVILLGISFPLIFIPHHGISYLIDTGVKSVMYLGVPAVLLFVVGMFARTLDAVGEGEFE